MAYEDIYKGLSKEEHERMLKQDIPKFEVIGNAPERTEEEKERDRQTLLDFIEGRRKLDKVIE